MNTPVSILIPAFNEEQGLPPVLRALLAEEALAGAEIIVVDDGSRDGTAAAVAAFPQVRLVRHRVNRGYGSAIRSAAQVAKGELIAWYDADGQHRVEDLLKVLAAMRAGELDYCIGIRDAASHQVANRKFGKWILRRVVEWAAGQPVSDFNSGLRAFRREVLNRYVHLLPKGFGASTTTTLLMAERSYNGGEVPITVLERVGKSSVKQFRDGCRTLMIILRILLIFKPLQFFGRIGGGLLVIGALYGAVNAFATKTGFPVLAVAIMIIGIQALFFGLIADQISALRREGFER